jgi:hypothetical protein
MKILIIFLFAFISFSTFAQVKTGGGGVKGGDFKPNRPDGEVYDEDMSDKDMADQLSGFVEFTKRRDVVCQYPNSLSLKSLKDIQEVFVSLSFLKTTSLQNSKKCEELTKYLKCMSDDQFKTFIDEIRFNPAMINYIAKSYKITTKQAKKLIDFFYNMSESNCERPKAKCEV